MKNGRKYPFWAFWGEVYRYKDEMADLGHNFDAQKRKRCTSFKRATDIALEVVGEVDQHLTGEGSDGHVIVVVDSPKMGFHG